jgi:hypothetical protein
VEAMRTMLLATALTLALAADAYAQPYRGCEAHRAIGVEFGAPGLGGDFASRRAADGLSERLKSRRGREASVHGFIPIHPRWSLTAELGIGNAPITVEGRDRDDNLIRSGSGGSLGLRRFIVGLSRHNGGSTLCRYTVVSAGVYRFNYRGVELKSGGAAAMIGAEGLVTDRAALFFEIELSFALTKTQAPLTDAVLVGGVRPALGVRYRF